MPFVALLDANVLYPAYLRDLLLRLAQAGVYQPRWSAEILDEVVRNVKKGRDAMGQEKVDRMISLMKQHFEDAEVAGYEGLVPAMTNDPKARHVLAAAITGGADLIVIYNLRHFPPHSCEPYNIDAQGPDQLQRHPDTLKGVLEERLVTTAPEFSSAVLAYIRRENS